jgi:hypothetical protein
MKATPHSYSLSLSKVDKAVLELGIQNSIKNGKLSPDKPQTMARALEILGKVRSEIFVIVSGWDAQYILIPALETVPVNMIEDGMLSCLSKMANHE